MHANNFPHSIFLFLVFVICSFNNSSAEQSFWSNGFLVFLIVVVVFMSQLVCSVYCLILWHCPMSVIIDDSIAQNIGRAEADEQRKKKKTVRLRRESVSVYVCVRVWMWWQRLRVRHAFLFKRIDRSICKHASMVLSEYRPFWYQLKRNLCVDDYKFIFPSNANLSDLYVRVSLSWFGCRPYLNGFFFFPFYWNCDCRWLAWVKKQYFYINPFGC